MTTVLLEFEHHMALDSISNFRHQVEQALSHRPIINEQRNAMLVCLSEAGVNLVEHNPNASHIRMQFGLDHSDWWMRLEDNGHAWDPTLAEPGDNTADLSTSGRGLGLLQQLTDSLHYQPAQDGHWNRLDLRWKRASANQKPTLLVVDDDPSQRRLIEAYLAEDFNVHSVADGGQALILLERRSVDMVISDIRMPGMTGLDLRQQLAQQMATDTLPFIFLTAANDSQVQHQAHALGIDDFLLKPVSKQALVGTVNRVLERSRQVYTQLTERINTRISHTLTPQLPNQLPHWDIAIGCRNAGIGGGDLLLHKCSEQRSLLTLVDIMGHDEVSKFFSYAYCGYIRGLLHSMDINELAPALFLRQLSNSAYQDELLSQLTLTCAALSLADHGRIDIACAGHPAPLLISADGVQRLPVGGMLPGLMENSRYDSGHFCVKPGERIACFTDGLFESAADDSSRRQLQHTIETTLVRTCKLPLQQALEETMATFDRLAGPTPLDDSLLLLLEPCNPEAPISSLTS